MNIKNENKIFELLKKLIAKPQILEDHERPKYLPPNATDCGFNHGEPKKKK